MPPPPHPWAAPKKPILNRVKNLYNDLFLQRILSRKFKNFSKFIAIREFYCNRLIFSIYINILTVPTTAAWFFKYSADRDRGGSQEITFFS